MTAAATGGGPAALLVVAMDRRIAAAAKGYLEPAGHAVMEFVAPGPPAAEAVAAAAGTAQAALVDWQLRDLSGDHLGAALRRLRPRLRLLALVSAEVAQAEPAGWDAMVPLPLARDSLMRAVTGSGR